MISDAQLQNLKNAYYDGILKVREGDTWVEYQSSTQMRRAILDGEAELTGGKPRGSRLVSTSKGY